MPEVDTLETDVEAILLQRHSEPPKLFPCAFFCRKLSAVERNNDISNHRLLAVKLVLE